MPMSRVRPPLLLAGIVVSSCIAAGLLLASPVRAEGPAWDQEKVAKLARLYANAIDDLARGAVKATPQATAMQQRTRDAAVSQLTPIRRVAGDFADRLADGWGREDTTFYFERMRQQFEDVVKLAGDAVPMGDQRESLQNAKSLLDALARYYSPDEPDSPEE